MNAKHIIKIPEKENAWVTCYISKHSNSMEIYFDDDKNRNHVIFQFANEKGLSNAIASIISAWEEVK